MSKKITTGIKPLRIFISSVQKELELERAAVAGLISTDPFLLQHSVPVLFENEPPSPLPAKQPYLEALHGCAAYVLIIANEYGQPDGEISATHHEYRLAQRLKLPTIVFLRGAKDDARSPEVRALIAETKKDGYTYKRFHDREDLKPLMLQALQRIMAEMFGIRATAAEMNEGEQLIEAASTFESTVLSDVYTGLLDQDLLKEFNHCTAANTAEQDFRSAGQALHARGLGEPKIEQQDGFFVVTLPGPAGNYDRIKTPAHSTGLVTPAVEAKLNERQKGIMIEAQQAGSVTSGWCRKIFNVARDTANRDLVGLTQHGLLEPIGKGRGARYVLKIAPK